jgi:ABC-type polysaccharide/polyol phosphate transport system ATPase subunit
MSDLPAIEFNGVWKRFRRGAEGSLRDAIPAVLRRIAHRRQDGELREREFWAVRDVSFQVPRGEALGVIGPNGAGKSTVLKLLSGILRPNQGTLAVRGRLGALIELGAGFHPDLTGRENVFLNASILGMTRKEIDARYDEIVDFAGVPEFMDTPVKRYSSGMLARLGFAVAACIDPEVLLVDEVLAVGDLAFQTKCFKRMEQFRTSGAAIIFVSHNLRSVATLCDRSLLLIGGQVRAMGETKAVVREYTQTLGTHQGARTADAPAPPVRLTACQVFDAQGAERVDFRPGEEATVVVRARVEQPVVNPAVVLWIATQDSVQAFNTSTQRLGQAAPPTAPGDELVARFRLRLNLAPAQYFVGAQVRLYETGRILDTLDSGLPLLITGDTSSGGIAALEPECAFAVERSRP